MSSGGKEMFINTQERAVSVDINRLQKFANSDRAEFMRYLLDVTGTTDDLDAGSIISEPSSIETPLRAEIINGIMVKPQLASLNVLVDPGVLYAMNPDAAADDSNYKFIKDAGVTTLGSLVMTANSSGSTRIDVIECQPQFTNTETDNRDIFNPVTGLFTATSVTKAKQGSLTYRVRAGTPGAGFPGTVSGWLPLAVASVPNGTTSNDTITFWDVRPLVNDRDFGLISLSRSRGIERRAYGKVVPTTGILSGVIEHELGGRRIGGRIRPGVPLTDANQIDVTAAANQDPTSVFTGTKMWFLYFVCPFSLPRWARYTDSGSGSRVPRSPRGIPVISTTGPLQDGSPSAAITLPTSLGFGASTSTNAIMAYAGIINAGVFIGQFSDGKVTYTSEANGFVSATSLLASQAAFTLDNTVYNVRYPANARALWVRFEVGTGATIAATSNVDLDCNIGLQDAAGNQIIVHWQRCTLMANATGVAASLDLQFVARIPLPSDYPSTALATRTLAFNFQGTAITPTVGRMTVVGWELGP